MEKLRERINGHCLVGFFMQKRGRGRNGHCWSKLMGVASGWDLEALLDPYWLHVFYFVGSSILGFFSSTIVPNQKPTISEPVGCFLYFCISSNSHKLGICENARTLRVSAWYSYNIDASGRRNLHFHTLSTSQKTFNPS